MPKNELTPRQAGIFEDVAKFICAINQRNKAEIKIDSNLVDDLTVDSLDLIGIVVDLQERFHVLISDDQMKEFKTVSNIVLCIDNFYQ